VTWADSQHMADERRFALIARGPPEGRHCANRLPTLKVIKMFRVPMLEVGVVSLLSACETFRTVQTLPLGHVCFTIKVFALTRVITIPVVSSANMCAGSVSEWIMLRASALFC
jgi:hypothetical protein